MMQSARTYVLSGYLVLAVLPSCTPARGGTVPSAQPSAAPATAHASVCAASFQGPLDATAPLAQPLLIRAKRLWDGSALQQDVEVLVQGTQIAAVGSGLSHGEEVTVLDLGDATLLPGLIDVHTHLLHQGGDYVKQLVSKSIPARTLAASANARSALQHGFTSLRDVESEGAQFADVDLKQAINQGSLLGPRLWVSTRGISTVGRYEPFEASWELDLPTGAEFVVGELQARQAVREQIGRGADWIKVYADLLPAALDEHGHLRGAVNFTDEELEAIVSEAHRLGHKVAAHAMTYDGIAQALRAGVDSLEHAHGLSEGLAAKAMQQGVFVCPTLLAEAQFLDHMPPQIREWFTRGYENLRSAHAGGVKMAFATDLGSAPWSLNGAAGLALYVERLGMSPAQALATATTNAAELLGQKGVLGQIAVGATADLIAAPGNPLDDIHAVEKVFLVVKGGQVVRQP